MPVLGNAELGAVTFCASSYPNDECGANGLPLTPNSIKILGKFQALRSLEHPNLCKYLDLNRGKHERVIVVSEYYKDNLNLQLAVCKKFDSQRILDIAFEILVALDYINQHNIVHRSLCPHNILLDNQGKVKLAEYGMYYMTDCGSSVAFPIGKPKYMAPEVIYKGFKGQGEANKYSTDTALDSLGFKVDVWSLGVVLVELVAGNSLWSSLTLQQTIYKICSLAGKDIQPINMIAKDNNCAEQIKDIPVELYNLIEQCLCISPSQRPSVQDLLRLPIFKNNHLNKPKVPLPFDMFSTKLRCADIEIPEYDEKTALLNDDHLSERPLEEVYYFWCLAGGDLDSTLKKAGLIRNRPPINSLSSFVTENGDEFGQVKDLSVLLDHTYVILSQDLLRQRLEKIDPCAYYPLLEDEHSIVDGGPNMKLPRKPSNPDLVKTATLPLVIREKDIEYQFHRVILYDRLLKGYPYNRERIIKQAEDDIPPIVRASVWAALLKVEGDVKGFYDSINREIPSTTDRQIDVDVPRCHQYNELLSSPVGHKKFKRVLKAWVVTNPQYVYWQGLDSLCAPFLYLNFNREEVAFACLSAFIPKYLNKFFLKDNSQVIEEYLHVFKHLIAFHDPELHNHLDGIGFIPDLYAISWFLTMYAHVFPLHKIFHLWDTLLRGDSSFPLYIGVAILKQLKAQLLDFGFNECILLFSDMPEIDIEQCVRDSKKIFCTTPKSATYRQFDNRAEVKKKSDVSYSSPDYNRMAHGELSMEPIPIPELKSEKCLRLSAEDLITYCGLTGASKSSQRSEQTKPTILIIDVRPPEDFLRGTIPGSINIPFITAFNPDDTLVRTPAVDTLNSQRNRVKVVVGSKGQFAKNFAEYLLRKNYSRVCVLHKGIDVFRSTGLLVVPPPEL